RISPDGQWVVVIMPTPGEESPYAFIAYPLRGGRPIHIGSGIFNILWSADARHIYFYSPAPSTSSTNSPCRTSVVALRPGMMFPPLPASGLTAASDLASLPSAKVLDEGI